MRKPYTNAPHTDPGGLSGEAPNAALLIDFDNVTMGMRSDLAKELRHLLDADIIKGKVTVQRAYADWRRYPQYIVPLSEASIDLIFAPAYGSSKKNATDIRMAIDGIELVFIRPEIGIFILLTGDSDFSSLVLKLKEYGKYVIGIGIRESSSDILVQNCDEYYSYTSIAGLSRATEGGAAPTDAWRSVEEAVQRMVSRGDVMRSDRLKQVIMEISPGFSERDLGFKKFSKFLVEAANKGLLEIERADNGQHAISPPGRKRSGQRGRGREGDEGRNGKSHRSRGRRSRPEQPPKLEPRPPSPRDRGRKQPAAGDRTEALALLSRALKEVGGRGRARDSAVKRKMIAIDKDFDEGAIGFGKFSKFLQFAEREGVAAIARARDGSFRVALVGEVAPREPEFDAKALGLPTSEDSIKSYLANRYKGVGAKTAERLVSHFGTDAFRAVHRHPERVRKILQKSRANAVLTAWAGDYERRARKLTAASRASSRGDAGAPKAAGRAKKAEKAPARAKASGQAAAGANSRRAPKAAVEAPAPDRLADASEAGGGEDGATTPRKRRSGLLGYIRQGLRSRSG